MGYRGTLKVFNGAKGQAQANVKTWIAHLDGKDFAVTSNELMSFQRFFCNDNELLSRMSEMFWSDIYIWHYAWGFDPRAILQPVLDLEMGKTNAGLKPATSFNNAPLNGLWHQHFFSAHFLVQNLRLGLGENGTKKRVDERLGPGVITQEKIAEFSRRIAVEPFEQRQSDGKVTGEWIVFAKHGGKNYYLSLNVHSRDKAGDQFIYDRIMQHCLADFADLPAWIAAASAKP
jgi:hypothetical protein